MQVFELLASVPWLDDDDVKQRELKGMAMVRLRAVCVLCLHPSIGLVLLKGPLCVQAEIMYCIKRLQRRAIKATV
jgi:hypothetical protein